MNLFTFTKLGRLLLAVAVLAVSAVCWLGCGGDDGASGGGGLDSKLVCGDGEAWVDGDGNGYIFKSNGDLVQVYRSGGAWEKAGGTKKWKTDGNKLSFSDVTCTYTVQGNTLTLRAEGMTMTWTKTSGVYI